MTTSSEAASRFTGRAQNYARFRPGYPDAVIHLLQAEAGWSPQAVVADIGAGTGLSSELFLRHGNRVIAVEPNAEMRAAAEQLRARYGCLTVVDGRAEATTLPDASAGFVVAGTAFHWFDSDACRAEFRRIIQPRGWVVLLWNIRQSETSPFLKAYEELLLRFGTDYKKQWGNERKGIDGRITHFFGEGGFHQASFPNPQQLDFDGVAGRLLSASYAPLPGHPNHEPMMRALRSLYEEFAGDGLVTIDYRTTVYWGLLHAESPQQRS
ncbi:MAG TPA: class I SAM-dependent methyltransferase [Bryobacteraceae bacterium]|nr:class I SAM-dependent methyltransferase [Bryobacteraceae bacterium]